MLERFQKATESHTRNKNYQFYFVSSPFRLGWQYGNHAEEVYTVEFMWSKLDYIPLRKVSRLCAMRINKCKEFLTAPDSELVPEFYQFQIVRYRLSELQKH
jgi:hypothetical protein